MNQPKGDKDNPERRRQVSVGSHDDVPQPRVAVVAPKGDTPKPPQPTPDGFPIKRLVSVIGKATRKAIDAVTEPLTQRVAALEQRIAEVEGERNDKHWDAEQLYGAGTRVIHKGCTWIATRATVSRIPGASEDWQQV